MADGSGVCVDCGRRTLRHISALYCWPCSEERNRKANRKVNQRRYRESRQIARMAT